MVFFLLAMFAVALFYYLLKDRERIISEKLDY